MYTYSIYVPLSIFPSVIFNLHHLNPFDMSKRFSLVQHPTEQLLPRTLINGMRVAAREPWASNLAGVGDLAASFPPKSWRVLYDKELEQK